MLVVVLFTSVGQEAQAAKEVKWPYGTYVATGKQVTKLYWTKKLYLDWQYYTEPTAKYSELIRIYTSKSDCDNLKPSEEWVFRKIGSNKYRTKRLDADNHYLRLTLTKKKAVIKEIGRNDYNYLFKEGPYNLTFKLKKRLSKNVG